MLRITSACSSALLAATLILGSVCDLDDGFSDGSTDDQSDNTVTLVDAVTLAQAEVPQGTVIEAYANAAGTMWTVELFHDGLEHEVELSRDDGTILDVDQDTLDAEDAAEAAAEASSVQASPGWASLIATAESSAIGVAIELDVDAEDALLEVDVQADVRWTVELDTDGDVVESEPAG